MCRRKVKSFLLTRKIQYLSNKNSINIQFSYKHDDFCKSTSVYKSSWLLELTQLPDDPMLFRKEWLWDQSSLVTKFSSTGRGQDKESVGTGIIIALDPIFRHKYNKMCKFCLHFTKVNTEWLDTLTFNF